MTPGRSCPLHYRYAPADFARGPDLQASCIYIVGGLYGNTPALDAIGLLAAREATPPALIFNGDFNWFEIDDTRFASLNARVLAHIALRGNVETELGSDDPAAGCGCGYPEFVADEEVARSNRIIEQLRETARRHPPLRSQLAALPMHMTANVGALRVAIVHGDCESLAGWGLSREALGVAENRARVSGWFNEAKVSVIASSHSCLPVLMEVATAKATGVVVNNGAAGMPNFAGTQFGVITRIGMRPSPHPPLYGACLQDVHIDALAVHYDTQRWLAEFGANWPPGSPAHASYARRIASGPDYAMEDARISGSQHAARRPLAA